MIARTRRTVAMLTTLALIATAPTALRAAPASDPPWPVLTLRAGGAPGPMASHGSFAWLASGTSVVALDVAAPDGPREIGRWAAPVVVTDVAASDDGQRLAAIAGDVVYVLRIAVDGTLGEAGTLDIRPRAPNLPGATDSLAGGRGRRVAWHGRRLVVGAVDQENGIAVRLRLADASGDGPPRWVAEAERSTQDPFLGANAVALAVEGDRAAFATVMGKHGVQGYGVDLFDLSVVGTVTWHRAWPATGRIVDLAALGANRLAILGNPNTTGSIEGAEAVLTILDIAGDTRTLGVYGNTPPGATGLASPSSLAVGPGGRLDIAFSQWNPGDGTASDYSMRTIDVSDPSQPMEVARWAMTSPAITLAWVSERLLWRDSDGLMRLVVRGTEPPETDGRRWTTLGNASDIAVTGGRLCVAAAGTARPLFCGPDDDQGALTAVPDVPGAAESSSGGQQVVRGNYDGQELAHLGSDLWLLDMRRTAAAWRIDLSTAGDPRRVGRLPANGLGVAVRPGGVWLGDETPRSPQTISGPPTIVTVHTSMVAEPGVVGRTLVAHPVRALAPRPGGLVALLSDRGDAPTLAIFDADAAGGLSLRGTTVITQSIREDLPPSVVVSDTVAYVAWHDLSAIDISDPARPIVIGNLPYPEDRWATTKAGFGGLALDGTRLFAAAGPDGFVMVDVRDPTRPRIERRVDTPGTTCRVAVAAGRLYVADFEAGVSVYRLEPWAAAGRRLYLPRASTYRK